MKATSTKVASRHEQCLVRDEHQQIFGATTLGKISARGEDAAEAFSSTLVLCSGAHDRAVL